MLPIIDFPDLKLHLLYSKTITFNINQIVTNIDIPPDKLVFLETLQFQWAAGPSFQIDDVNVDGVDMQTAGTGNYGAAARTLIYNQWIKNWYDASTPALQGPAAFLPCRRSVSVTVQNNTVAGDGTLSIWGYIHDDFDKEYNTVSARQ